MEEKEIFLKLAKSAHELADQFERGEGPDLGVVRLFNKDGSPCCALGHVLYNAGITVEQHSLVTSVSNGFRASKVVTANDCSFSKNRKSNVIAPLRHLAEGWKEYAEKLSK